MLQQIILPKYNNKLEEQLINLFHGSDLPLHFNKTGNKEFTNYQRISIIILFYKSNKSLRDFIVDIKESRWISWLGLKKIPQKSTLHDWLNIFDMKIIRKICKVLLPEGVKLTSIDGTGFDSWQRSRHYEKRVGEAHIPHMPYAKSNLFIDVKTQIILDFDFVLSHEHDVKGAERIFKRFSMQEIIVLADKGYDSEKLHEIVRNRGGILYAPVRKSSRKKPKGRYRRECVELPEFIGMRSINETVNSVLKRTQIHFLRSKKPFMKKREFGWNVILYNIKRKIKVSSKNSQTFIFFKIEIHSIRTEPKFEKVFKIESSMFVMKKGVNTYFVILLFIALAIVCVYYFGGKLTGFAVIGEYTNESSCVSHGYIWTNFTNQGCTNTTNCVNITINCEPCLAYEDINGTQGNCTNWSICTSANQTCTTTQNCTTVVVGGQCTGDVCDSSHLNLCLTETNCASPGGGHWYNNVCNSAECASNSNCNSGYECISGVCIVEEVVNETIEEEIIVPVELPVEIIEPTKLSSSDIPVSSLYSGDSQTIKWTITNVGILPLYSCNLKFTGDYASWISFNENNADINLGGQKEFIFNVSVPEDTNEGSYSLSVSVECAQISESKTFVVNVLNEKLGLDILSIERTSKGRVRIDYSLKELSGENQTVGINFSILNSAGQEVSNASANKNISANLMKEFKIYIPINKSLEGNLTLSAIFDSSIYSSSVKEPIVLGAPVGGFAIFEGIGTGSIIILAVVVLSLIVLFVIVRRIRKKPKNKKSK